MTHKHRGHHRLGDVLALVLLAAPLWVLVGYLIGSR